MRALRRSGAGGWERACGGESGIARIAPPSQSFRRRINATENRGVLTGQCRKQQRFSVEEANEAAPKRLRIVGFTLPNDADVPPSGLEVDQIPGVSRLVRADLLAPIVYAAGWKPAVATFVSVPKAAVNENDLAPGPEDEVGTPGQVAAMERVPVSHTMQQPPDGHFGAGVPLSDRGHDPRSDFRCAIVDHLEYCICLHREWQ